MPSKYYQRDFEKNCYYHIFNRGSNKQIIFPKEKDYLAFTSILSYYIKFPTGRPLSHLAYYKKPNPDPKVPNLRVEPVQLIAYCLMPNHFHLLLKQTARPAPTTSITNLMRRLSITYAMYFNEKHQHSGNLFQGKFKNVTVKSEAQLLYLSKYIHRNPLDLKGSEPLTLSDYPYSSYPDYLNKGKQIWIHNQEILSYFSKSNPNLTYQAFVEEPTDYPTSINKLLIE